MEHLGVYYKLFKNNLSYSDILDFVVNNADKPYLIKLDNRYFQTSDINQNLELKIHEFQSLNWEVWERDIEMNNKLDEVRDKVEELGVDVDIRFYDLYKMDIEDIFNYMFSRGYFSDDELASFILNKKN